MWAIDSLSGVVLSGLPRGASSSSKASAPKAILWGRCGNGSGGSGSRLRNSAPVSRNPGIKFAGAGLTRASAAPSSPLPAAKPAQDLSHAAAAAPIGGTFSSAPEPSWLKPDELLASAESGGLALGLAAYVVYTEGVPVGYGAASHLVTNCIPLVPSRPLAPVWLSPSPQPLLQHLHGLTRNCCLTVRRLFTHWTTLWLILEPVAMPRCVPSRSPPSRGMQIA